MATAPRVRFAPSPTGYLHIGGARTALFNWLHARRQGGTFVLRIEDTDQKRSTLASEQAILDALKWLGVDWDEGPGVGGPYPPYFQMQRLDTYKAWSDWLIEHGHAYRCYCTPAELDARRKVAESEKRTYRYEGTCRERTDSPDLPSVVRFKTPHTEGGVSFEDQVLGKISKEYSDFDDFVLLRGDGIPLYNFGCVVDDHLMAISLVGRGQEHVNSTFLQLMIYDAIGWEKPLFAHFPLILGPDREKLSKRLHPEADVMEHRRNGILPEALLNFIVRLGWSHGDDEVISREQMIQWFGFDHVGSTSGVWNPEKLLWVNAQWLKSLPAEDIAARWVPFLEEAGFQAKDDPRLPAIVTVLRERNQTLVGMAQMARYFFSEGVTLDEKAAAKHLNADGLKLLGIVREKLAAMEPFSTPAIEALVKEVSEQAGVGMGKVAQPMRVAVTGGTASPGIGETLSLVGKPEVLRRLDAALKRSAA